MLTRLWKGSAPLTATGLAMTVVLAGTLLGLVLDPRLVTGAPVWLKPAKFAASIAIYTLTLAWICSLIPEFRRTRHVVGSTTAAVMVVEMAIIGFQASRGTTSHFNVATPLDMLLFGVMGTAIVVQTFASVAVAVALWRSRFTDRALGWALRFGMTITIIGALVGGLMTQPTANQLSAARAGERMTTAGAHTVGAPDGGPGVPGTGWSTTHGDLRVPHFVGLHALQVLPILALVLPRRRLNDLARARLVVVAAGSYLALFGILLLQALRGQSIAAPDASTVALMAAWALGTAVAATAVVVRLGPVRRPAAAHTIRDTVRTSPSARGTIA